MTSDTNGGPGGYHPFWISCLVSNIISWNTTLDSAFIYDNIGVFSCKIMNAPRNYIILNKGIHCDVVSAIFTQGMHIIIYYDHFRFSKQK